MSERSEVMISNVLFCLTNSQKHKEIQFIITNSHQGHFTPTHLFVSFIFLNQFMWKLLSNSQDFDYCSSTKSKHNVMRTIFVPENKKVEQEGRTVTGCVSADTEALEVGLIFIID